MRLSGQVHVMQAVIFDMDGVLVDSNALHFRAFRALAAEQGITLTDEMLQRTFGMHNREIMPMLLQRVLSPLETVTLADRKELLYRQFTVEGLPAIPGALVSLELLHAQATPLAVGSSGPRANVELGLRVLGMARFFQCVITGDDVKNGKPDPEVFLKCAHGLGFPPAHCVVIEDAPTGIQAARAAGMRVLAVTTSRPRADLADAHRVVDSLDELADELRGLAR